MDETTFEHRPPGPIRTYPGIAWGVIIFVVLFAFVLMRLPISEAQPGEDDGGVLMTVQGKVLAAGGNGATGFNRTMYITQAEALNVGSVGQRQRAIVLLGDVGGPDVAAARLDELDQLIAEHTAPDAEEPIELSEVQRQVQEILHVLYSQGIQGVDEERPRVGELNQAQRDLLEAELGWFGRLALAPPGGADRAPRRDLLSAATVAIVVLTLVVFAIILIGFGGLVGLILLVVFAFQGRLGSGLPTSQVHHGMYAETFAVWLVLFYGLQLVGGFLAGFVGQQHQLFIMFIAFFMSLIALSWPVIRGASWSAVRRDVGLHFGRSAVVEGALGVGGYTMALPLLGIGLVLVVVFMIVDQAVRHAVTGEGHPFESAGPPGHPIIEMLQQPGVWVRVQMLLAVAVAAPVVEEIMFRGVFYRHLREALRSPAVAASLPILGSALITGFIFAAIHPVPWFAWPGLLSLAVAFALIREWRGSIVPAIIMHAIHNGLLITFMIVITSV